MTITVHRSRIPAQSSPTRTDVVLNDGELHDVNLRTAAAIFKHLVPILASGDQPFYQKILASLVQKWLYIINRSALRSVNMYYRKTVQVNMSDLWYWGVPTSALWTD